MEASEYTDGANVLDGVTSKHFPEYPVSDGSLSNGVCFGRGGDMQDICHSLYCVAQFSLVEQLTKHPKRSRKNNIYIQFHCRYSAILYPLSQYTYSSCGLRLQRKTSVHQQTRKTGIGDGIRAFPDSPASAITASQRTHEFAIRSAVRETSATMTANAKRM